MTRLHRFLHTVASSYVLIVASALYQLGSVPLGLHYLGREEFGLWVLMSQVSLYLVLFELGMTNSVARLLVDYKDQRDGGDYGSLLQTGWWVLVTQGAIVLITGFCLTSWLRSLLRIPGSLGTEFTLLMYWTCALQALTFTTRILPQMLFAHQRSDVANWVQVAVQPLSLAVLWIGLFAHQGVYSFVWQLFVSWIFTAVALAASCARMGLFPHRGNWGHPTWRRFRELFDFGKDAFLVSVGYQLVMASQTFIITRNLGLATATSWSVCTKAYALINQIIWRISDFSMPAFSEMVARGERERVRMRLRDLVMISGSIAGLAGILFALCNQTFVLVWTRREISWPVGNDLLLACWMMILAVAHAHCTFVPATGRIGFMRYVYFMEGFVFLLTASFGARIVGIPAIIAASIVCTTCFSGLYGSWHTAKYCGFPLREVMVRWQVPALRIVLLLAPLGIIAWWLCRSLPPVMSLLVGGLAVGSIGSYVVLRFGIPPSLREELMSKLPTGIRRIVQRLVASH